MHVRFSWAFGARRAVRCAVLRVFVQDFYHLLACLQRPTVGLYQAEPVIRLLWAFCGGHNYCVRAQRGMCKPRVSGRSLWEASERARAARAEPRPKAEHRGLAEQVDEQAGNADAEANGSKNYSVGTNNWREDREEEITKTIEAMTPDEADYYTTRDELVAQALERDDSDSENEVVYHPGALYQQQAGGPRNESLLESKREQPRPADFLLTLSFTRRGKGESME